MYVDQFECKLCQKQLSTQRELRNHIDYVHRNVFSPCEICGKPLKTPCYTYHIWSHKNEQEKLASIASGEKPPRNYYTPKAVRETFRFYCEKCKRYFCSQAGLNRHIRNHEQIDAKKDAVHLCAECGKTFASSQSLINHKRFVHDISKQRKYACPYCSTTYLTKGYLRLHVMSHTGEKPLTCEICGKGFVRSNHLKWHMITHGDERPYACKICNMTYRRPAHLRRHHDTVHLKKSINKSNPHSICTPFIYIWSLCNKQTYNSHSFFLSCRISSKTPEIENPTSLCCSSRISKCSSS